MPDSDTNDHPAVEHQTRVRSRKQIIGYEEGDDPSIEPLFANHFELFQIGTDIYLDIGIVRPEEIIALKRQMESAPTEEHELAFNVLQRIAMSRDGFERLKAGVETITKAMRGEVVAG